MSLYVNPLAGGRKRRVRRIGGSLLSALLGGRSRRRKTGGRKRVVRRRGAGFFGDLWNAAKPALIDVAKSAVKPVLSAVKDPAALALAQMVGKVNPWLGRKTQQAVYSLGEKYGFGRRKRRVGMRRKRGAANMRFWDMPELRGGRRYKTLLF